MTKKTLSASRTASGKTGTTRTTRTKKTQSTTNEEVKKNVDLLTQIKIDIKHKNETQKKLTTSIKNNDVTICIGPAGTGKTLLSVAEALILLKNNPDKYFDIKLVKSIVQLQDEDMGTLPGDEKDKLKFIMMSFLDAFYQLIGVELTEKLIEAGYIKMLVFGSIRGRSLPNSIILFDEFQNISDKNAKTFLTRFSEDAKVVALGDTNQIDMKKPEDSCLAEVTHFVKNVIPEDGVCVVEFLLESDIVRHRLTKYFVHLFEHKDYKKKVVVDENKLIKTTPKNIKSENKKSFFSKFLSLFR
jgi:phosphate starvation-inducible PhoH-like protein